jgi:hypothetical protein
MPESIDTGMIRNRGPAVTMMNFDSIRQSRPPWLPTTVSWCAALTAVALAGHATDSHSIVLSLVGWLAGGVVTAACAIAHRLWDRQRRQQPGYSRGRLAGPATALAPAVGILAGLPHAWVLAWFLTQWLDLPAGAA